MSKQIISKKEAALHFFNKTLLRKIKKEIKAIYLFGSLARGSAAKDSDIDVLVFSDNPRKTFPAVWEVSLEVYQKFGESIEPLVYSSKNHQKPNSYFLYQVINEGKRLYPSQ